MAGDSCFGPTARQHDRTACSAYGKLELHAALHRKLRTADAVHLVTAKSHAFDELYSNDIHLLAAAPHFSLEGKNIIDPV
jgi:predicted nucleic acid-binding protein